MRCYSICSHIEQIEMEIETKYLIDVYYCQGLFTTRNK